jgi:Zn-dependent protease
MKTTAIKFSRFEITELLKAWLAISIAFTIMLAPEFLSLNVLKYFAMAALTVGVSFLAHELGHKVLAQRYGCWAEFRAFNSMLILAIIMSFFGFIFAAPGAVFIRGHLNRDKYGKISLVGPLTNILFAIIFLIVKISTTGLISEVSSYGLLINAWLAVFNMLPFLNFDGAKIFKWNKPVYFIALAVAASLMILQFYL